MSHYSKGIEMNLRKQYLSEWRVWYSFTYKARRDGVEVKPEWLDFEQWINEVGPRPKSNYQFCRDNSHYEPNTPWTEHTAGWRNMPLGRLNHCYQPHYVRGISAE